MCHTMCSETIRTIRAYLNAEIDEKTASDWALGVIRSSSWEELSGPVSQALHLLFDLHDYGAAWAPDREQLRKCLAELESAEKK